MLVAPLPLLTAEMPFTEPVIAALLASTKLMFVSPPALDKFMASNKALIPNPGTVTTVSAPPTAAVGLSCISSAAITPEHVHIPEPASFSSQVPACAPVTVRAAGAARNAAVMAPAEADLASLDEALLIADPRLPARAPPNRPISARTSPGTLPLNWGAILAACPLNLAIRPPRKSASRTVSTKWLDFWVLFSCVMRSSHFL